MEGNMNGGLKTLFYFNTSFLTYNLDVEKIFWYDSTLNLKSLFTLDSQLDNFVHDLLAVIFIYQSHPCQLKGYL